MKFQSDDIYLNSFVNFHAVVKRTKIFIEIESHRTNLCDEIKETRHDTHFSFFFGPARFQCRYYFTLCTGFGDVHKDADDV
jgi:hypothetical protein